MVVRNLFLFFIVFVSIQPLSVLAESSDFSISSFKKAKKYLADIYRDNKSTFYCGCEFNAKKRVNNSLCGYEVRKNRKRGSRIEWEHVVPASRLGRTKQCWKNSEDYERCYSKKGKVVSGRKCCRRVDAEFRRMEADMMNLVPTVGELNADRSNYRFSVISGEKRQYGACDFEVDRRKRRVEPREEVRGDIARIYFYMEKEYGLKLTESERKMFENWQRVDPISIAEQVKENRVRNLLTRLAEQKRAKQRFASDN